MSLLYCHQDISSSYFHKTIQHSFRSEKKVNISDVLGVHTKYTLMCLSGKQKRGVGMTQILCSPNEHTLHEPKTLFIRDADLIWQQFIFVYGEEKTLFHVGKLVSNQLYTIDGTFYCACAPHLFRFRLDS